MRSKVKTIGTAVALWGVLFQTATATVGLDGDGFVTVTLPGGDEEYYVSQSVGNDAWDGTAPAFVSGTTGPKKTIADGVALLTAGGADHLYLKGGDTFLNESFPNNAFPDGRSATEPILVSTYGTGRANIRPDPDAGFGDQDGYKDNGTLSNVVFQGLDIRPNNRQTDDENSYGFDLAGSANLTFDDCYIAEFTQNVIFGGGTNVTFRNCIIVDSWGSGAAGSPPFTNHSGIYSQGVANLNVVRCFFDHNGGQFEGVGDVSTFYDHSLYTHADTEDLTVDNCIMSRTGGPAINGGGSGTTHTITNTLFVMVDSDAYNLGDTATAPNVLNWNDNVLVGCSGGLHLRGLDGGTMARVLIINSTGSADYLVRFGSTENDTAGIQNFTLKDSIFYNTLRTIELWNTINSLTIQNCQFQEPNLSQNEADVTRGSLVIARTGGGAIDGGGTLGYTNTTFSGNTYHRGGTAADWFYNGTAERTFAQWGPPGDEKEATAVSSAIDYTDETATEDSWAVSEGYADWEAFCAQARLRARGVVPVEAIDINDYFQLAFPLQSDPPQSTRLLLRSTP
jgi:hypothetical protein